MTRVLTASDTALLMEASDLATTMRLLPAVQAAAIDGVIEIVPAARTILVRFDPHRISGPELAAELEHIEPKGEQQHSGSSVTISVHYDGQDLAEAAQLIGVSTDELVARHQSAQWRVAFTGYAPGFGYLVCDDPLFDVPRRSSPRTRIPAGSVGVAGTFSGVYPRESPGGWQLIGRTDTPMWDLERDPPALLAPGTLVQFIAANPDHGELSAAPTSKAPAREDFADAPRALEVVRPGLQLLLQDAGRVGMAATGVSQSGAADRAAMRAANRTVGNLPGDVVLELAGGGAVLRARGPLVVAVTGALVEITVTGAAGTTAVAVGVPAALDDGDEMQLGPARAGFRSVIAVRGGLDAPRVLGSASTDTLAGLGPSPLAVGDLVPVLGDEPPRAVEPMAAVTRHAPRPGEECRLRITLGPRYDWFTPASVAALTEQTWLVTSSADRVGIRLEGEPLERSNTAELPSEGAVTGAIQVPSNGQPVLFLPDHPLTGGYPIIGAVIDADLDLAGQLPPGALVRFQLVTVN